MNVRRLLFKSMRKFRKNIFIISITQLPFIVFGLMFMLICVCVIVLCKQ